MVQLPLRRQLCSPVPMWSSAPWYMPCPVHTPFPAIPPPPHAFPHACDTNDSDHVSFVCLQLKVGSLVTHWLWFQHLSPAARQAVEWWQWGRLPKPHLPGPSPCCKRRRCRSSRAPSMTKLLPKSQRCSPPLPSFPQPLSSKSRTSRCVIIPTLPAGFRTYALSHEQTQQLRQVICLHADDILLQGYGDHTLHLPALPCPVLP